MPTVELTRALRIVPRMPGGELTLEPPPEPDKPVPPGVLARVLPAVLLVGSVAFVALGPANRRRCCSAACSRSRPSGCC